MGVASCLAGCAVILINLIFLIVGIIFTALGVILKFGSKWISAYIEPLVSGIVKAISDNLPGANIDIAELIQKVFELASSMAVILLVLGIFFLILAFTGMCGVCCKSKYLLMVFCGITGVVFIAVLAVAIWSMSSKDAATDGLLVTLFKTPMLDMIKKYKGAGSFDINTLVIDLLNMFLKCCGVNNGTDFESINWNKQMNYTINGEKMSINLVYPVSCCKLDSSSMPVERNCTFEPTLNNSNYNIGCWDALTGSYLGYFNYLNYALLGLCGFFLILLVLGVLVLCGMKDNKVSQKV